MNEARRPRIHVVDALRALALLGILLVHCHDYYNAAPPSLHPGEWMASLNGVADWLYRELFVSKAYLLFAFLFGLSTFLQLDHAERKGVDFRGRFMWRLALLVMFGLVHTLFYNGDVLMIFGVFGVALVALYRVPSFLLACLAAALCLNPGFVFDALAGCGDFDSACLTVMSRTLGEGLSSAPSQATASWWDLARWNVTDGLAARMCYMVYSGRLSFMLGMFLCGMLAGRSAIFDGSPERKKLLVRLGCAGAAVYAALAVVAAVWQQPGFAVERLLVSWQHVAFVAGFVGWVSLLLASRHVCGKLGWLSCMGRMSLTCYVMQSVVMTWVLFGWGLGLGQKMGTGWCLLAALMLYGVQLVFCRMWMGVARFGPLEWLWRSATLGRWQPLRKDA